MSHKRFVFQYISPCFIHLFYRLLSMQKQPPEVFCKKKCVLGKFTEFTGKHLCQTLFFNKETQAQVLSCEFCKISKYTFFTEHLRATAPQHDNFLQKPIFILQKKCLRTITGFFTKITVILCLKILCYLKLSGVLESEVVKFFYTFSRNELPNQYAVNLIQSMKLILVIYVTIY